MTSPNTGVRRTALAVLAVGATLGLSACGAGQISQTANQVAAVDGGSATNGDLSVSDVRVVLPQEGSGTARVAFTASYTGSGLQKDAGVRVTGVEVAGTRAQVEAPEAIGRNCAMVFPAQEGKGAELPAKNPACLSTGSATLPSSGAFKIAQSVPAKVTFSNGTVVEARAGVVAPPVTAGEYERPESNPAEAHSAGSPAAESHSSSAGH